MEDNSIIFTCVENIPKFYDEFPDRNITLVTELFGRTLESLYFEYGGFSAATVMRIGLQIVSANVKFHILNHKMSIQN